MILCGILLWGNICVTNTAYLSLDVLKEESTALAGRVADRIERSDDFTENIDKLAVIGKPALKYYTPLLSGSQGVEGLSGIDFVIERMTGLTSNYALPRVMSSLTGFSIRAASEEEIDEVRKRVDIGRMPCWPDEGSVRIFDGTVLVKFGADMAGGTGR